MTPTLRLIYNLKSLFGLNKVPGETQVLEILGPTKSEALRPCFEAPHHELRRGKVLEDFIVLGEYDLLAVVGSGQFASNKISSAHYCVKNRSTGTKEYNHQMLGALIVHPERGTVLPLDIEQFIRADSSEKNDCERNAGKRLIASIAGQVPQAEPRRDRRHSDCQ